MKAAILGFVFVFMVVVGPTPSLGAEYPAPVGRVNDFASILSDETEGQLNLELAELETLTPYQVAVVTVPSLGGESVETYALGLANTWGVGKKDANTGVLLLVAPNERKVRIEVGRGFGVILSQRVTDRIISKDIIPRFKSGDMEGGIVAGTQSLLGVLEAPYLPPPPPVVKIPPPPAKPFPLDALFMVALGLVLFWGIAYLLGRVVKHMVQHDVNMRDLLPKLVSQKSQLDASLDAEDLFFKEIKEKYPATVWSKEAAKLRAAQRKSRGLEILFLNATQLMRRKWRSPAFLVRDILINAREDIQEIRRLFPDMRALAERVANAERDSRALFDSLPSEFERVATQMEHPDVGMQTRCSLDNPRSLYAEAQAKVTNQESNLIDWLIVVGLLAMALEQVKVAEKKAKHEKEVAEKARTEGPELLEKTREDIEKAEQKKSLSERQKKALKKARQKLDEAHRESREGVDPVSVYLLLLAANSLFKDSAKADPSPSYGGRGGRFGGGGASGSFKNDDPPSSGGFGGFGGGSFGGRGSSGSW